MNTKIFHIGELLTAYTGTFVAASGMDGVQRILSHLVDDAVHTHQIPLAICAVHPELKQQFPWLQTMTVPLEMADEAACLAWVDRIAAEHGAFHVVRSAHIAWGQHDPVTDFTNQYPRTPVIAVHVDGA